MLLCCSWKKSLCISKNYFEQKGRWGHDGHTRHCECESLFFQDQNKKKEEERKKKKEGEKSEKKKTPSVTKLSCFQQTTWQTLRHGWTLKKKKKEEKFIQSKYAWVYIRKNKAQPVQGITYAAKIQATKMPPPPPPPNQASPPPHRKQSQ